MNLLSESPVAPSFRGFLFPGLWRRQFYYFKPAVYGNLFLQPREATWWSEATCMTWSLGWEAPLGAVSRRCCPLGAKVVCSVLPEPSPKS